MLAAAGSPPRRADILIVSGAIGGVLAPGEATSDNLERIDASGFLVIPGLVNGHTHGHGGLAKGAGDLWSLELLLNAGPWMGGHRTDDDRYLSTVVSAVEMLRKGCTACYDLAPLVPAPTVEGLHTIARAYSDVGLRAVVAPMIADRTFYEAYPAISASASPALRDMAEAMRMPDPSAVLSAIDDAARDWPFPADGVRLGIGPTIPLHCSDTFLRGCAALAERHGMPLQTHLAESQIQVRAGHEKYGTTLTGHLAALGLLGPHFSAAHGVWLTEPELDLLAGAGASLSHNPGSNLRLGSGVADVRPMLARGLAVGVGTDGSGSSDNQNMFEAMRLAAYVSRVHDRPPAEWIAAREAIAMATEGSAHVLGLAGRIGRIAPGFLADLVFLDLDHVNLVPLNDAANQLVNTEDGGAVRHVMIGGRFMLRDGVPVGVAWPAIAARARDAAARLATANAETRLFCEAMEPMVTRFCAGMRGGFGDCRHHDGLPCRTLPGRPATRET